MQGIKNLELVLLASVHHGITGVDGYAWITGEMGFLKPDMTPVTKTTPSTLRPLVTGWISIQVPC